MATTEVTAGQYRQFDPDFNKNDLKTKPADEDAAAGVTWEQAYVCHLAWTKKLPATPKP